MTLSSAQHARRRSQTLPDTTTSTHGKTHASLASLSTTRHFTGHTTMPQFVHQQQQHYVQAQTQTQAIQSSSPHPSSILATALQRSSGSSAAVSATQGFSRNSSLSSAVRNHSLEAPHLRSAVYEKDNKEREMQPVKEKTKMKLFSKSKSMGIIRDKDTAAKRLQPPLPSPAGKPGIGLSKFINASSPSLSDVYSVECSNVLTGTSNLSATSSSFTVNLMPLSERLSFGDRDRERGDKHKPHLFLLRQKNRHRDEQHHGLSVFSSANGAFNGSGTGSTGLSSLTHGINDTGPGGSSSLSQHPSFMAQSSPGFSTIVKTVSSLDLRHGGKALWEKRREDKNHGISANGPIARQSFDLPVSYSRDRDRDSSFDRTDSQTLSGNPGHNSSSGNGQKDNVNSHLDTDLSSLGLSFGISGLTAEDAWPLLKARSSCIFEGEEPRFPIEDFNALLCVHISRCLQRRVPGQVIDDVINFLTSGFASIDQTLQAMPDHCLFHGLVDVWRSMISVMLPFIQAIFVPLDAEFRSRSSLLCARDAAEIWNASCPGSSLISSSHPATSSSNLSPSTTIASTSTVSSSSSAVSVSSPIPSSSSISCVAPTGVAHSSSGSVSVSTSASPTNGKTAPVSIIRPDQVSVKRMALLTFRDRIILSRYSLLISLFSRLSLENFSPVNPSSITTDHLGLHGSSTYEPRRSSTSSVKPSGSSTSFSILSASDSLKQILSSSFDSTSPTPLAAVSSATTSHFSSLRESILPNLLANRFRSSSCHTTALPSITVSTSTSASASPSVSTSTSGSIMSTTPLCGSGRGSSGEPMLPLNTLPPPPLNVASSCSLDFPPLHPTVSQSSLIMSGSGKPAAPWFTTNSPVCQTVGRMLQCISVLTGLQSDDTAQFKMELLNKELKQNWLGRERVTRTPHKPSLATVKSHILDPPPALPVHT